MRKSSGFVQVRELLFTAVPVVALLAVAFWLAWKLVPAPPPNTLVIGAATPGSPYHEAAKRYAEFFQGSGVKLVVRETRGSLDNLSLLKDERSGVDAAFLQGGLAGADDAQVLQSVGRIFFEPVWIFERAEATPISRLADLKGKRVIVGPSGSGTEAVALRLLASSGVTRDNATLVNAELPTYPETLEANGADAGFLVLAPEARTVKRLFDSPHARLVSLAQADAYAQRFPFLSRIELKQGVVDFARNVPGVDSQVLSTTAAVVTRKDLHPALVNLLTQAVIHVHAQPRVGPSGENALLHRAGVFPLAEDQEFSLSPDAQRVYKSGPPFLQRYMPFYWAVVVDRFVVFLVPALGILVPTLRFAPTLYTWRVRRRIIYWYKELKKVEAGITPSPTDVARAAGEVERIEEAVNRIPVPLAFANQLYDLRQHIDVVRRRLNVLKATPEDA
ncbi:MAG: C4-dicarboxylate ABC transporter substrate-binding protein [Hyphomicrobiales bacterium]|nr:MAG: C4-dicarboxylate ABC transporter substrate-binding protein [Hyphomicrobiales bacterium]